MIDTIDARLLACKMMRIRALAGMDFDAVRCKVSIAARAVAGGVAG